MHRPSLLRTAAGLAIALSALAPAITATPARAQIVIRSTDSGPGGPGGAISRSTLDRYSRVLGLDDAQKQAAAALHESYMESSRELSKDFGAKMKDLNADLRDGDREAMESRLPALLDEHGKKASALQQAFLTDLKALLTAQQAEANWPRLERLRRRDQWLRAGVLSGSSVDLVSLVDDLKLPDAERGKLADTLEQYELDLDRALQDLARDADAPVAGGGPGGPGDGPKFTTVTIRGDKGELLKRLEKQRQDSARVKEVNQRYARLLSSLLPDNLRAALDDKVRTASFKQIYRDPPALKRLEAAQKFEDLTADQRARLRDLADRYRREARAASDRWAAAQERAESEGRFASGPAVFMNPGAVQSDELKEARQARRDLDKKVAGDLDGLLTDDQKSRLPVQTARRGPGGAEMDMVGDPDGDHMVIMSSVDETDDGSGAVVSRVVIGAHGQPGPAEEDKKDQKKDEPKPPKKD